MVTIPPSKVVEHCSPQGDLSARYAGRWAYQLAVDTIAYAQNIPLRIVLLDKLNGLPTVIKTLVESPPGQQLLDEGGVVFQFDRTTLYSEELFSRAVNWLLCQGSSSASCDSAAQPPEGWYSAMLLLLPHIERAVWLTEMGNPHPAHAVTRMLDHWSLYVLCWCYQNRSHLDSDSDHIERALDIDGYQLLSGRQFVLPNKLGQSHRCRMIVGPTWGESADTNTFENRFFAFVRAVESVTEWRQDLAIKAPSRQEIRDALNSRVGMPFAEARLRADSAQTAFVRFLCGTQASVEQFGRMARDDWEQLAMLCSWLARWQHILNSQWAEVVGSQGLWVSAAPKRGLCLRWSAIDEWQLTYCTEQPGETVPVEKWNQSVSDKQQAQWRIDLPSVYWNRTQERQNAAWTAQIVAINNLLQGHAGNGVGSASAYETDAVKNPPGYEAGNHLLRGYGGRICHHLLSLARADVADLYWYDYAQDPPRLTHVGGYMRLLEHRMNKDTIHRKFDGAVWRKRPAAGFAQEDVPEADKKSNSKSQAYRVAATGREDMPRNGEAVHAVFDAFVDPKPVSAMAFPLLVNQRVVGVLTLAGLSRRQFSSRLSASLHRTANLVGHAMYEASSLWQMRQITDFFARTPFERFGQYDKENAHNPLGTVSRCLANVFLCRGVHIWLTDRFDKKRHKLYGNNLATSSGLNPTYLHLDAKATGDEVLRLSQPFLAFARELCDPSKNLPRYALPQARFAAKETGDSARPYGGYTLTNALSGLWLPLEFVPTIDEKKVFPNQIGLRQRIFEEYGFHDLATLALIQESPGGDEAWVGGVTLHDVPIELVSPDAPHPKPWPDAWQAVAAHVQTFLPNLLSQVEILNRPLDDMRRFLLHEGRAELQNVRERIYTLVKGETGVLSPDGLLRAQLRNYLRHSANLNDDARSLEKQLGSLWTAIRDLDSDTKLYRLDALVHAIDDHRELAQMGFEMASGEDFVDVEASVRELLSPHEDELRRRGVHASIEGFDKPVKLWVHVLWWERIISNLVDNAGKYALESFEVRWLPESKTLRFSNTASYDSELDDPEKLFLRDVRGSSAPAMGEGVRGQGYGLWGTRLMCKLAGLRLTLNVVGQQVTVRTTRGRPWKGARYHFDLQLPSGGRLR